MTEKEVEKYYAEWEKVGIYCNSADYFEIFKKSKLLITDCASFLVEYFPSKHPVIQPRNRFSPKFLHMVKTITDTYYQPYNLKELKKLFKLILEENKDPLKEKREKTIDEMNFLGEKTSSRILKFLREKMDR